MTELLRRGLGCLGRCGLIGLPRQPLARSWNCNSGPDAFPKIPQIPDANSRENWTNLRGSNKAVAVLRENQTQIRENPRPNCRKAGHLRRNKMKETESRSGI
jgi:hypothetical protein